MLDELRPARALFKWLVQEGESLDVSRIEKYIIGSEAAMARTDSATASSSSSLT